MESEAGEAMRMGLRIGRDELERLRAHCRAGYPHEVVGLLAGDGGARRVTRVVALQNERAETRDRYAVDARALWKAERAAEADGLVVLGYYHSHPDHPARYSEYDREQALPNMSYLIAAVEGGEVADLRCWRLREDRAAMDAEPLEIEES